VLRHSDMIVIDPLENIMKLFDRNQQYELVRQCLAFDGIKGPFLLQTLHLFNIPDLFQDLYSVCL